MRYQINDWLAAGAFVGWSSGDGNSFDQFDPQNTGTNKFSGQGQGLYIAATHAFTDKLVYSISPSYTHNKSKSKYTGADQTVTSTTRYTLTMWHIDQSLSYFFDSYRARATGGYTIHIVGTETDSDSAKRSNTSGTAYIGGSYLVSVNNGIELYGVATRDFGDDVYDDTDSFTLEKKKNF